MTDILAAFSICSREEGPGEYSNDKPTVTAVTPVWFDYTTASSA